jgi:LDH2 family malate/lactate/ureidoglycolate dehydrogenase
MKKKKQGNGAIIIIIIIHMEQDKNRAQNNLINMLQEINNIRKQQITIPEEKHSAQLGFARW